MRIYPGADGDFTLYEDENDNYEKGSYATVAFHWNDKDVVIIGRNHGIGVAPSAQEDRVVAYTGKAITIKR